MKEEIRLPISDLDKNYWSDLRSIRGAKNPHEYPPVNREEIDILLDGAEVDGPQSH